MFWLSAVPGSIGQTLKLSPGATVNSKLRCSFTGLVCSHSPTTITNLTPSWKRLPVTGNTSMSSDSPTG